MNEWFKNGRAGRLNMENLLAGRVTASVMTGKSTMPVGSMLGH